MYVMSIERLVVKFKGAFTALSNTTGLFDSANRREAALSPMFGMFCSCVALALETACNTRRL